MTGLVRKATFFVVCGLLATAAVASAGVPYPGNCTVPAFINIVGSSSNVVDAAGAYTVVVRDQGNNPIPGTVCQVTLDFTGCTDLKLCSTQLDANITSKSCIVSNVSVTGIPDGTGTITFKVMGAAINKSAPVAGPGLNCVAVQACGVTIGHATAVVFDENGAAAGGSNGVETTDFVSLLKDWGSGVYYGRSDFNHAGPPLSPLAFSPWLTRWGAGSSTNGCTSTFCP